MGGRIFDGVAEEARPNSGVRVRAGRIVEVDGTPPKSARVERLGDEETLLPGFFDLHAHYAIELFDRGRVDETHSSPLVFLGNGVTSTYPAGEVNPDKMRALERRLDEGDQIGPRLFRSGPYFGLARKGWHDELTDEELRAEIDELAAEGVRCLKVKDIMAEQIGVIIERAHHHGMQVTGHLNSGYRGTINPKAAIELGIDRVEHFLGGDQLSPKQMAYRSIVGVDVAAPAFDEICDLYIDRGVYFDATMSAFGYYAERDAQVFTPWDDESSFFTPFMQELLADRPARQPIGLLTKVYWKKREHLLTFFERGGGPWITVGTDHPSWGEYLAGFGYHRELHCLALSGLPTHAVLKAATINGARALRVDETLGTIEPGKLADMVVIAGDPLADITKTRNVRLVMKEGELFQARELLESSVGRSGHAPRTKCSTGEADYAAWADWARRRSSPPPRGRAAPASLRVNAWGGGHRSLLLRAIVRPRLRRAARTGTDRESRDQGARGDPLEQLALRFEDRPRPFERLTEDRPDFLVDLASGLLRAVARHRPVAGQVGSFGGSRAVREPDALVHAEQAHHSTRNVGRHAQVVASTGRDIPENELFRRAPPHRHRQSIEQLVLRLQVALLVRQLHRVPESRSPTRDDRDLLHGVGVDDTCRDQSMSRLVVGDPTLLLGLQAAAAALRTGDHLLDGLEKVRLRDLLGPAIRRDQRGFVDDVRQVGAGHSGCQPCNALEVDVGRQRLVAHVHAQDRLAAGEVG